MTADFGASYFINGSRFVSLILFLKYFDEASGDFKTECLYNIVTDPDERSEDAFYVRAVTCGTIISGRRVCSINGTP